MAGPPQNLCRFMLVKHPKSSLSLPIARILCSHSVTKMRILLLLFAFLAHVVLAASATSATTSSTSRISAQPQPQPQHQPSIPIIDIAPLVSPKSTLSERQAVANQINQACTGIGFFAIVNHGIPRKTIDALLQSSRQFFDMSIEDKLAAKSASDKEYPYGYERSEVLSKGKKLDGAGNSSEGECGNHADISADDNSSRPDSDMKETFSLGPKLSADGKSARRWPSKHPDKFVSTHEEYYAAMEDLAHCLLRGFALALGLKEEYFRPYFDEHQCALRTLNYPQGDGNVKPGQIRAGAHTDYGALTILKTGGPGLQVRKDIANEEEEEEEGWIDAPDLPDAFICNIGDMMRRWCNDRWVSTLHRVVVPQIPVSGGKNSAAERRQSVAFFVNARGDARVEPLPTCVNKENPSKYEPVTAGEYLLRKHLASMGSEL